MSLKRIQTHTSEEEEMTVAMAAVWVE